MIKLNTLAKNIILEKIDIRKDWFDVTKYLEIYLVGDDFEEKQTNLDSLSDEAYSEIVLDNDAYTGEYEKPLKKWVRRVLVSNKYPEYLNDIPNNNKVKVYKELYSIISNSIISKESDRLNV
jgi:hypothetical protein